MNRMNQNHRNFCTHFIEKTFCKLSVCSASRHRSEGIGDGQESKKSCENFHHREEFKGLFLEMKRGEGIIYKNIMNTMNAQYCTSHSAFKKSIGNFREF